MSDNRIALYLGNEIYPSSVHNPASTISNLQESPLTSAILCLLNHDTSTNTLVYNDATNPMYSASGDYIGPPSFPTVCSNLRGGNINEIYMSFSTSGTEFLKGIGTTAASRIFDHLKSTFKVDGVDLDYEGDELWAAGSDFSKKGAVYFATDRIVYAGLNITAAPYSSADKWQSWVDHVQGMGGTVPWLNLQCYSGGAGNDPNQVTWNVITAPILGGVDGNDSTPAQVFETVTGWRQEAAALSPQPAGPFSGGFFWAYSNIKAKYGEYGESMALGLNP